MSDLEGRIVGAVGLAGASGADTAAGIVDEIRETGVDPGCFTNHVLRRIYTAQLELVDGGEPPDVALVAASLNGDPEFVQLPGGLSGYLAGLVAECTAFSNAAAYARALLAERSDSEGAPTLRFAAAGDFAAVEEESAEPIIGGEGRVVLTADGTVIVFAEAGEGKTTLTVDMAAHAAAGIDWLGLAVARALRVAIVENEGSRGPFRRKIAAKIATWDGPSWAQNVYLLEEPWGHLDLTSPKHRHELATMLNRHRIDVLVLGPLVELGGGGGAAHGGTPAEVTTWTRATLVPLRDLVGRPIAVWIIHHENKSGDISGAWRRYPDTLLQVVGEGDGRSALKWAKARHGTHLQGTVTRVEWDRATAGYTVVATGATGPRKAPADAIAIWIRAQGGRATPGDIRDHFDIGDSTLRERRTALAQHGIDYRGVGKDVEYLDRDVYPAIAGSETESHPAPAPRGESRGDDIAGSNGSTMRDPDPAPRDPAIQTTAGSGKRSEQGKSLTPHPASLIETDPPTAGSGSDLTESDLEELLEKHADLAQPEPAVAADDGSSGRDGATRQDAARAQEPVL